jgi:large subunit ribosomal protein L35
MPKMKTRKSAAKRYAVTGTGKVRMKKQGLRHILTKKSSKRKRNLRHPGILHKSETKRIRGLLPYSF